MNDKVLIVMGSKSDKPVVEKCISVLKEFDIKMEVRICSAHRTPELAEKLAKEARENNFSVIIAAAGKAAHLPGVLAAYTSLPVIGLPIKSSTMDGLDSLLSIVQMPSGIPVATVAINGSENAALLAVQMMANSYTGKSCLLSSKIVEYKNNMKLNVLEDDKEIRDMYK